MNDRFKFNAIVSSYYDIDTPENYEEFEPQFYLENVDVFCTGEIGIDYDVLFEAVKEQSKNLTEKEIGQIMKHFEDNSNSPECDYLTITPDKILQSTGLKDKNGKLIYEGDIVKLDDELNCITQLHNKYDMDYGRIEFILIGGHPKCPTIYIPTVANESEVIGNIYENKDLLNA